jgi:hypothetical protein
MKYAEFLRRTTRLSIDLIGRAIMNDNDFTNFEENGAEKHEQESEDLIKGRPRRKKRRPWAFPLGVFMLILSLIGLITIISSLVGFIREKTDGSEEIAYYNSYLTWIVANDPDSFDDISKANKTQLLDISILTLLYDELNTRQYELIEEGLAVPAKDVQEYFQKLFGTELEIEHKTVSGLGYTFSYDPNNDMYYIPLTGVTPPFTPRVVKVDKTRETVVITVGYIGTDKLSVLPDGSVSGAQPDKYMKITLRKSGGEYRVYSIQAANPLETGS